MTKTLVTLIFAFVVVFAAGAAVGLRHNSAAPAGYEGGPPELSRELNLTDAQRDQLKAIWQPLVNGNHQRNEQRRALEAQRDKAVHALLTPDQLDKYKAVMDSYHQQMDAIDAQRHKAFTDAEDATRAILSPEQREKYEALLKARHPQSPATQPGGSASPATQP